MNIDLERAKDLLSEKFSFNADFLHNTVEELQLKKSVKILDIGTGFGVMSIILALQGYKVTTGEPEGHNWAAWRESAKKLSVEDSITFKFFRAEDLPFNDNSFDALFCYTSFHHVDEKQLALREFVRVTKDKGLIVIFEFNPAGIELVRKSRPSHPDMVNPEDFSQNLPLSLEFKKGRYVNAYIFRKNEPR
ncbi:MAG: class I SAM-dependent methyltransferase [Promethearchaeota archaeon]|jgi:ubiquinone/menaquinone biosynthesis C-methylase UbiE